MQNTQLYNDTGIPYMITWIIEQFKKFHSKLKTIEGALHFNIGKITNNRRLKPRLPQVVLLEAAEIKNRTITIKLKLYPLTHSRS